MQRSLRPLLLRGAFGVAFSFAAVASAATEAARFEGDWRFEQGRLVLVSAAEAMAGQCAAPMSAPLTLVATGTGRD